jgi:hypothetical protein
VDVKRVDRVELHHVHEVDPNELCATNAHGRVHEMERNRVDRVDLVVLVEVRVERVLHHQELVRRGTPFDRIDDERPVEAFRDVPGQRRGVAVVQMQPERLGLELVGELLADLDQAAADVLTDPGRAVHLRRVDAVEVNGVRMRPGVDEVDAQQVAFVCTQRRPRHAAVVRPRGVPDARDDLDVLVVRDELPLAERAATREATGLAPVEVAKHQRRSKPFAFGSTVAFPSGKPEWDDPGASGSCW